MTGASAILKDIQSKMHNVRYACDKLRDIDKNIRSTIKQKQAYKERLEKELENVSHGDAMAISTVLQFLDINLNELRKISADLTNALEKL